MNNLQIFENPDFGQVRMIMIENEPYFVGKDVAEALGYSKTENAIANHVDEEDKTSTLIQGSGSHFRIFCFNESFLVHMISKVVFSDFRAHSHFENLSLFCILHFHFAYAIMPVGEKK